MPSTSQTHKKNPATAQKFSSILCSQLESMLWLAAYLIGFDWLLPFD